jgi:hypothetical protein
MSVRDRLWVLVYMVKQVIEARYCLHSVTPVSSVVVATLAQLRRQVDHA